MILQLQFNLMYCSLSMSGTFDQAANLLEVSCGSWPESNYQRSTELIEERLKQTLAEAMAEGTGGKDTHQHAGARQQKGMFMWYKGILNMNVDQR